MHTFYNGILDMVVCAEFLVQVAEFLMKWQGE